MQLRPLPRLAFLSDLCFIEPEELAFLGGTGHVGRAKSGRTKPVGIREEAVERWEVEGKR